MMERERREEMGKSQVKRKEGRKEGGKEGKE